MSYYYPLSLDNPNGKERRNEIFANVYKRKKGSITDIEQIFIEMMKIFRKIRREEKTYEDVRIIKLLDEIIPHRYFGSSYNRKRFYNLVNKVITQARLECVYISIFSKGYDLNVIQWLRAENLDEIQSREFLGRVNRHLLIYIVNPLIKHFYHPLKLHRSYEVIFIKRNIWHRFNQINENEFIRLDYLIEDSSIVQSKGILKLFPKTNCESLECRPIMSLYRRSDKHVKYEFRRLSRQIQYMAKNISPVGKVSLYTAWKKYSSYIKDQYLYGIKLDIKDAFGNVNIFKICDFINHSELSTKDKYFIVNHIENQYISFNGRTYKWQHGLLQGDYLSSSLSNLFLSIFERENVEQFYLPHIFIHRLVDDYLFCSPNYSDVIQFEKIIMNNFEITESKTERVTPDGKSYICYLGQVIDLKSKEVNKLYNFKKGKLFHHRFKFWNIKYPFVEQSRHLIISKSLNYAYNNHYFQKIELNTFFNKEETVLRNFFEGMIFLAFKFHAAVTCIKEFQEQAQKIPQLKIIIDNTIHDYCKIVYSKINCLRGSYFKGNITFKLLVNVSYRAFVAVLKKNNEFYKDIIETIEKQNNLYLCLKGIDIHIKEFGKVPYTFQNINISRRCVL